MSGPTRGPLVRDCCFRTITKTQATPKSKDTSDSPSLAALALRCKFARLKTVESARDTSCPSDNQQVDLTTRIACDLFLEEASEKEQMHLLVVDVGSCRCSWKWPPHCRGSECCQVTNHVARYMHVLTKLKYHCVLIAVSHQVGAHSQGEVLSAGSVGGHCWFQCFKVCPKILLQLRMSILRETLLQRDISFRVPAWNPR